MGADARCARLFAGFAFCSATPDSRKILYAALTVANHFGRYSMTTDPISGKMCDLIARFISQAMIQASTQGGPHALSDEVGTGLMMTALLLDRDEAAKVKVHDLIVKKVGPRVMSNWETFTSSALRLNREYSLARDPGS